MKRDTASDSPDTNTTNSAVGSQVVSASVAGVTDGTRLSAPVRFSLRPTNALGHYTHHCMGSMRLLLAEDLSFGI